MLTKKQHAELKEEFVSLLRQTEREGIEELITYLEATDFFMAPARMEHGCAYPGGLLEHSLDVYHILKDKLAPGMNPLWNVLQENADFNDNAVIIVALLHDLYKIGVYHITRTNVRNYDPEVVANANPYQVKSDKDGKFIWESVPGYRYEDTVPLGKGEKSVMTALRFIKLTDMELFSIRWHLGYRPSENMNTVNDVFAAYPLAMALYEADMEATFLAEKDKLRK